MYGDFYEGDDYFLYDDDDYVNVWVDGSCRGNGQPGARAGYGVFYNFDHRMNVSAPVRGRATNNAGEIQAAIRAIWDLANCDFDAICINTDSQFLIDSVCKYLDRWEQNGFCKANGEPLANRRDFINMSRALNRNSHMQICFRHVYAHDGNRYNEEADRLAKEGARQYGQYYYY